MTKKHFEAIADALALVAYRNARHSTISITDNKTLSDVIDKLGDVFYTFNSNFDYDRFADAIIDRANKLLDADRQS